MNSSKERVTDALKRSDKGKLKYDRQWSYDSIEEIIKGATNFKTCLNPVCFEFTTQPQKRPAVAALSHRGNLKAVPYAVPEKVPRVISTTDEVNFGYDACSGIDSKILEREAYLREHTEKSIAERRKHFATSIGAIYNKAAQDERECYIRRKLESERQMEEIRASLIAEFEEDKMRLQKFKEENELRAQLMDERIRAVERQKLLDMEAAAKKKAAEKERMDEILAVQKQVNSLYESIMELTKRYTNSSTVLPNEVATAINSLTTINSGMQSIVQQCRVEAPTPENVQKAQELLDKLRNYHDVTAKAIQKIDEEAMAAAKSAATVITDTANNNVQETLPNQETEIKSRTQKRCVDTKAVERYGALLEKRDAVEESYRQIVEDKRLGTYRADLMKAVNTPINAISSQSGEDLLDKLDRLTRLVTGNLVASHPAGRAFVLDLMAKKFVSQGKHVAHQQDTAFPIAAVIVGLWKNFPEFGELFLAHVYAKCPYLVPCYIPKPTSGTMDADYYRALGYNCVDGVLETEGEFLKRMSGITQLYAAVIQSSMPKGMSLPHPHGPGNGWAWLSAILNLEPQPKITATVILHFLEVCGHTLQATYKIQFQKLLLLLCKDFFPKIKAVTPAGSIGSLSRLEVFLQRCLKQGKIPRPDGTLPPNFWYTR